MTRRKRSSKILEKAERRVSAMRSISETLDLGNGLTIASFTALIGEARTTLAEYNKALSGIDKIYNDVQEVEQKLGDLSELMLLGVVSKYGKNSDQYEMAGGVRKSDRRRSSRTSESGASTGVSNGANNGTVSNGTVKSAAVF